MLIGEEDGSGLQTYALESLVGAEEEETSVGKVYL
jgi:hypothetical protein